MPNRTEKTQDRNADETLTDWAHNPAYQQSPVDHFSAARLPACSRSRAIAISVFLGFWGVQRFYLRRPAMGWLSLVVCKVGLLIGLLLLFFTQAQGLGLFIAIAGPTVAELIGLADAISLGAGWTSTDGKGKPLDP